MKTFQKLMAWGLLLSLPALLVSCWGKCVDKLFTPDHYAYFLDFKPGDYWIYRNVANGDIDSVYFVSRTISPEAVPKGGTTCSQEYATVRLKGFAKSLTYEYIVQSWDGTMQVELSPTTISYYGKYDVNIQIPATINGRNYAKTISTTHCCIEGCTNFCGGINTRFNRLEFAKSVGIVRWEAIRHPQFGTVIYELIRSNKL